MENHDPPPEDFDAPISPLMAVKLAAFRRGQAEKELAEAIHTARASIRLCLTRPMDWPLLSVLSQADRREFTALARLRSFAAGEVVYHEGDPADSLHLVAEGHLAVRVSLPSGDVAMINVLGPGDYFGELALLRRDRRRTATITALEPTRTLVVTASAFRRLCADTPAVEHAVTEALAERVDELSQTVLELMFVGLDRRVYRRLLDLADTYGGDQAPTPIVVPFTQAQLAELTGGTRPSVNQALQHLVADHTVVLARGKIEVHDLTGLRRRCGL